MNLLYMAPMKKHSLILALLLSLFPLAPSFAQDAEGERIEKLERDLMLLQRQVSRGGAATAGSSAAPAGNAHSEVQFSALEEQIRQLRGQLEESQFQNRKLSETLDKLQRDVDFRFNELAKAAPKAEAPKPEAKPETKPETKPTAKTEPEADTSGQTTAGDGVIHTPDEDTGATQTEFSSPREHYNYAFRLLNQTQYDKAAEAFATFVKKYPKDPLVGNAYYWQGETYYIRRDYVNAADSFRQGFEELPTGPKAPDNLLKLAMSLNALERDKEACIVLGQVVAKFKKTSTAVTQKAEQEQKRIDCK